MKSNHRTTTPSSPVSPYSFPIHEGQDPTLAVASAPGTPWSPGSWEAPPLYAPARAQAWERERERRPLYPPQLLSYTSRNDEHQQQPQVYTMDHISVPNSVPELGKGSSGAAKGISMALKLGAVSDHISPPAPAPQAVALLAPGPPQGGQIQSCIQPPPAETTVTDTTREGLATSRHNVDWRPQALRATGIPVYEQKRTNRDGEEDAVGGFWGHFCCRARSLLCGLG
jgi:hypothetical protein